MKLVEMKLLLTILLLADVYSSLAQLQRDSLPEIASQVSEHQYDVAIKRLENKLADTPSIDMLNLAGYCYSKLGRYSEAVSTYEHSLELDSANITTLSRLADLYKSREEFLKASHLYNKLSEADSLNSYFYKQNAYCLYKAGLVPFSIILYEQANRLNPGDEEVVLNLARIYMGQENYTSCDSLLNLTLAGDTANTRLLSLKAKSKYSQREYDSTLVVLEAVFSRGDTSLTNIRLAGNAHYGLDNYAKSISWFEKIPTGLLDKDEYTQYMMGISYRYLQQADESIIHLEKAIELGISGNISLYYQQLGLSYEVRGKISQALKAFETAREYKKDGILYYQIARIHDYYKSDSQTALEYYKRYLASGDSSVRKAWEFSLRRVKQLE